MDNAVACCACRTRYQILRTSTEQLSPWFLDISLDASPPSILNKVPSGMATIQRQRHQHASLGGVIFFRLPESRLICLSILTGRAIYLMSSSSPSLQRFKWGSHPSFLANVGLGIPSAIVRPQSSTCYTGDKPPLEPRDPLRCRTRAAT